MLRIYGALEMGLVPPPAPPHFGARPESLEEFVVVCKGSCGGAVGWTGEREGHGNGDIQGFVVVALLRCCWGVGGWTGVDTEKVELR